MKLLSSSTAAAHGDHVTEHFDPQFAQEQLGQGRRWRRVPPIPAQMHVPARSGPRKNCISALPPDRRGPGAATLPACAWRNRLAPPEAIPASSSNLCFRAGSQSGIRWLRRDAHPREYGALSVSIFIRPPRPKPCCRRHSSRSRNAWSTFRPAGNPERKATSASP